MAVKKRLNELVNPEGNDVSRKLSSYQKDHKFLLLHTNRHSEFDPSLKPRQLQLMKKLGIVSDYCFTEEAINPLLKRLKHLSTLSPKKANEDIEILAPRLKLSVMERAQTLEPKIRKLESSFS